MRIKTIKIKIESDNQEFDFNEFFEGSSTIYTTNSQLVKEEDGYYWHAFITFDKKYNIPNNPTLSSLPEGFEDEIENFIKTNPPKNIGTRNCVLASLNQIIEFRQIESFLHLRTFGQTKLKQDEDFLKEIIKIVKKYKP